VHILAAVAQAETEGDSRAHKSGPCCCKITRHPLGNPYKDGTVSAYALYEQTTKGVDDYYIRLRTLAEAPAHHFAAPPPSIAMLTVAVAAVAQCDTP
jgi:hypothetical protein